MVYGTPAQNLRETYAYLYNQSGPDGTAAWSELAISDIVLLSPTKLQVVISSKASTSAGVNSGNSEYNIDLGVSLLNKNGIQIATQTLVVGGGGESNGWIRMVFEPTFTELPVTIKIDSTVITRALRLADGSYWRNATAQLSNVIMKITPVTSDLVICKTGNTVGDVKRAHLALPTNPVIGQTYRIKSASDVRTYIHPLGTPIDNGVVNNKLYYTYQELGYYIDPRTNALSTQMYAIGGHGFTLLPLHACMLMYDGTRWLIQEYYDGARVANVYDWELVDYTIPANAPTNITEPLVICDVGSGQKFVRLPSPMLLTDPSNPTSIEDNSLRFVRIIVNDYNNTNNKFFVTTPNGVKLEDEAVNRNSFYLRVNAANGGKKNACISFISDGTKWWVYNVHTGAGIKYGLTGPKRDIQATSPIAIIYDLSGIGLDGVMLPSIDNSHDSKDIFIKMPKSGENNGVEYTGVVAQTPANAYMGFSPNDGAYSSTGNDRYTHTAASVVAINPSRVYNPFLVELLPEAFANPIYYITGYYFGYYIPP